VNTEASPAGADPYAPPVLPASPPRAAPSRLLAIALSFFAAGVGQFYLGQTRRALGWLTFAVFGVFGAGLLLPHLTRAGWFVVAVLGFAIPLLARPLSAVARSSSAPRSTPIRTS